MKVFLAIKHPGRGYIEVEHDQLVSGLVQETQKAGHIPFVGYQEILRRGFTSAEAFMPFVRQQIQSSDLLVLLYNSGLRGGLIEAGIAYAFGVPVWLLYPCVERVSSSALGIAAMVIPYQDIDDLQCQLAAAFQDFDG